MKTYSPRVTLFRSAGFLLPFAILIATGLLGLDFGHHWDEKSWQIGPVKTILAVRAPLPGHYGYPSFNYWINTAALLPDVPTVWNEQNGRAERLSEALDSRSYLLRLRSIYLLLTALSVLWIYLLVLIWRDTWQEALLASCFLAFSWEVAYHLRWVATDGMLMQFGALTALGTMHVCLRPRGSRLLYVAAVTAGLGMGTKYPGGLLVVPVLLAGILQWDKRSVPRLILRLCGLTGLFVLTFLLSTPAILLRPTEVWQGILYEVHHYGSGHAGHTISSSVEHGWRMLVYLGTVLFSKYVVIALVVFGLACIGAIWILRREPRLALLFFSFPVLYFFYFSMQQAMVVRNLLVLVPFLAVLAARGAWIVWEHTGHRVSWNRKAAGLIRSALIGVAILSMGVNAAWLFSAAGTIPDRQTSRFAMDAVTHIAQERQTRFYLSPLVRIHFRQITDSLPENVTGNPGEAERVLLYASEGFRWWQSWPANRPDLTERWFGPYEVNFNIYPNWWGDDRIIEMTRQRADELGILVCCDPESANRPEPAAPYRVHARVSASGPQTVNWAIPDLEPCLLVSRSEAEHIIGRLLKEPQPGGTAVDGTACTYVAEKPIVARIGLPSTKSFQDLSSEPGNISVAGSSAKMLAAQINAFHDVRMLAKQGDIAVMITLAAWGMNDAERMAAATDLARAALNRLAQVAP